MSGIFSRAWLMLGIAVTDVHPGAGRSPGVVDLPVQRDPGGYPVIPRSEVKGALKTRCMVSTACIDWCKHNNCFNRAQGRVQCSRVVQVSNMQDAAGCVTCCCLYGPEPEEGEEGASKLAFTDMIVYALPARSEEGVTAYVTTPWLLEKLVDVLRVYTLVAGSDKFIGSEKGGMKAGSLLDCLSRIASQAYSLEEGRAYKVGNVSGNVFTVRDYKLHLESLPGELSECKNAIDVLLKLSEKAYWGKGGHGASIVQGKPVIIVSEGDGQGFVDTLLVRVTRVRLRIDTKTVAEGALWTEEYIPRRSLTAAAVLESIYENRVCEAGRQNGINVDANSHLKSIDTVILGGKYTLSSGIIRVKVV
ncbi:CRISPR-associated RAMP protein, Cmr4 family [Pyrolobus fumarii 1A]|uniref:CRISPR-associated RAMP protein, Cmr4 family n=1 Tax=Pyrolobus fumarii (strain DSM 11204 / 1A) TaxID=694429 RepID=G0EG69_PYRF1|nr:type III-B CRISPR module RAMP protein Cmr4 [Pyrolobus fumarii]AEM38317.1 CRISPR-associated RAMP protein, Cmr4 family [Pyrolobus fumarii 1A]